MRQVVLGGAKFLKFGKRGKPHIRYVCVNVLGNLHWDEYAMDSSHFRPSENFIRLKEVVQVCKGKESETLQRRAADDAPDYLCLSVVAPDRTLDLQAVSIEQRDLWVRALESVIKDLQGGMINLATGARLEAHQQPATAAAIAAAAPLPALPPVPSAGSQPKLVVGQQSAPPLPSVPSVAPALPKQPSNGSGSQPPLPALPPVPGAATASGNKASVSAPALPELPVSEPGVQGENVWFFTAVLSFTLALRCWTRDRPIWRSFNTCIWG